jgi:hypothetical protein
VPLLLIPTDGEALPLVILLSENPWPICAMAGAAATSTIASIAANSINFLNFYPPLLERIYRRLVFFHRFFPWSTAKRNFFPLFLKIFRFLNKTADEWISLRELPEAG